MKSILHDKQSWTCYLCAILHTDFGRKTALEEHHIFGGNPNRKRSEQQGLKVYLCPEHHRTGAEAVHRLDLNGNQKLLQEIAQKAFEQKHTREEFIKIFWKSYL